MLTDGGEQHYFEQDEDCDDEYIRDRWRLSAFLGKMKSMYTVEFEADSIHLLVLGIVELFQQSDKDFEVKAARPSIEHDL